jgi:hypothetical protein
MVAIGGESATFSDPGVAFLSFVDIKSGAEIRHIPMSDFQAAVFGGAPGAGPWLGDSSGVEVYSVQHKDSIYQLYFVARPDGSLQRNARPLTSLDPTGGRGTVAGGDFVFACGELGFAESALDVTREPGGTSIGRISVDGHAVVLWDWSPDGSEVLVRAFRLDTVDGRPCFRYEESAPWYVWSAAGMSTAADRDALLAQWQGARYVEFRCSAAAVPPSTQPPCGSGAHPPPFTLFIGGHRIDDVRTGNVVGFVN